MQTAVPEKVSAIIDEIGNRGFAEQTRLTVLKAWLKPPHRLKAFGLWIARKAAGRKGKTAGIAGDLLNEARQLLGASSTRESVFQQIDHGAARALYDRAVAFQNQIRDTRWANIRQIECWPLFLVEQGLALHIGLSQTPSDGYRLAADWAKNYDSKFGTNLNGPSTGKLDELVRFMFSVEALESVV